MYSLDTDIKIISLAATNLLSDNFNDKGQNEDGCVVYYSELVLAGHSGPLHGTEYVAIAIHQRVLKTKHTLRNLFPSLPRLQNQNINTTHLNNVLVNQIW